MNEGDKFALVARPPGAIEKAEPGAKRILSGMVAETLALAKKGPLTKPVFTVLSGLCFGVHEATELILKHHFSQRCDLRFLRFGDDDGFYMKYGNELLRLARENSFDLIVLYSRLPSEEAELLAQLKAEYGKPIIVASGMADAETANRAERAGLAFLPCPYSVKQFLEVLETCLNPAKDATDGRNKLRLRAKPRIVLVDDDDTMLEIVGAVMRANFKDVEVLTFGHPKEALQELEQRDPDLLITDGMMPHMNGAELIHRLLDKKVTYPMVLMSANNWAEQFVRELANPNVSFIRKPFSVPQLTEIVATRLGLVLARHTAPAHVDLDALVQEGKRIRRRQGMTPEDSRAFDLFHRAAVAGHGEAQLLVYLRQLSVTTEFDTTVFSASGVGREGGQTEAPHTAALTALVIYADPELEQLRQLVAGARARLAELEADYTREKSRVDAMQAVLFRRLREHYQKRDRLRLIVDYRRKYLDALIRGGEDEAKETEENYAKAKAQTDKDYEETAAAVAKKKQLTPDEDAELTRLWKKLVKLYHPDRFAHEPDKLETYHKLTAAINRAKDTGDIATLREIAEDPHGYILRQGWVSLDFSDEAELSQLRQLYETLELETITVIESLNRLRESPDYELCQISEKKPGVLDELAAERKKLLEKESVELEKQAGQLAEEIKELAGQTSDRIV